MQQEARGTRHKFAEALTIVVRCFGNILLKVPSASNTGTSRAHSSRRTFAAALAHSSHDHDGRHEAPNHALVLATIYIDLSVFCVQKCGMAPKRSLVEVADALTAPHRLRQLGVEPANAGQFSRLGSCRPAVVGVVPHTFAFHTLLC